MKRAFILLALATTVALSLVSVPASASDGQSYLALGDSVAFGFDPLVQDRSDPENFVGYPEKLAEMLDLDVTNASCPGETSTGLVILAIPSALDNGCRPYRARFPLHVDYTTSQLDFAVRFLREHPQTKLVTLNIGANDIFVLQKLCAGNLACVQAGLPAVLTALGSNLQIIYTRIRLEAVFHGPLVALTYYAIDYSDPAQVQVGRALNNVIAQVTLAAGGKVASGFDAWQPEAARAGGSSCAAGLLIVLKTNPLTCDIHPSPKGRDLLAGAIKGVVSIPVEAN